MNKKGSAVALVAVLLVAAVGVGVMLKGASVTGQIAANPVNAQVFMAQCQQKCFQGCSNQNIAGQQFGQCVSNCRKNCARQLQQMMQG
jgi:hypothetical protein